ncbi:MAG: thiamine pyrophosphate-binding protein [bacterium]|nr:thiamine pyrophosphate-binding protein [bacterium]
MKVKLSDYIAEFLADKGLSNVFTVVGGGSMHLNDSFGHHPKLHCIYHHHEQACSIAAEGYARIANKPGIVCVTSGPGAVNALNGVAGAYQDSIPMIVFSGQTKTTLSMEKCGLKLRTLGNQEFPITSALEYMAKYSETLFEVNRIKYCLEKAYHLAISGRPGPVWLDIPLDLQGKIIETDELISYSEDEDKIENLSTASELSEKIDIVIEKLKTAKRPVVYAGNGIRLAGAQKEFLEFVHKYKLPVVTCWDSIDLISNKDDCFCGRGGTMGDRAGNFAIQNSDLLICIGTRLNIYQVGFHVEKWAREAYVVMVDIDSEELKKSTIRVDFPICADAKDFLDTLLLKNFKINLQKNEIWQKQCIDWKNNYPVVLKRHYETKEKANVYSFIDSLSKALPDGSVTVVANGSASVVGSQTYYIGDDCRFLMNCAFSSMGWGLPASIGACVANENKSIICLEGDGSLMMNLQEIQTVVTNKLPIKLFIINNSGYHQWRQTEHNIFPNRNYIGIGPESGDLGFPNFEKVADAFGITYRRINNNSELEMLNEVINMKGNCLCEVMVTTDQIFEPKNATKKLPDGTLVSPPLEDMSPFLDREELAKNMYIPLID